MGHHRVNLGHMVVTAQDTGPDTGMAMVVIEVMVVMVEVMAIARARLLVLSWVLLPVAFCWVTYLGVFK